MLRRFVKIGLPSFAEGISMWSVNIFILQFIATIGQRRGLEEGLQGVHIVAVQWEAFSFLPGFAIGTAAGTSRASISAPMIPSRPAGPFGCAC